MIHTILLFLACCMIFLWVTDPGTSGYNLQLTAVLMIILVVTRFKIKPSSFRLVESIVSTMAVLLVIEDTGSIGSPLFFLNFFLLFELSLLLEPTIPLFLSLFLILFYLFVQPIRSDLSHYAILLSFPFLTPLAVFLGNIYRKEENQKRELSQLNKKVHALENLD